MVELTASATILSPSEQEALHRVLQLAQNQNYRVGTRLPAERKLADRLGVSRDAVRGALTHLQEQGIVRAVSPRIRVLNQDLIDEPKSLLSEAIVAVSFTSPDSQTQPNAIAAMMGASHFYAQRQFQAAGHPVMTLSPGADQVDRFRRALTDRPAGVLVCDDAFDWGAGDEFVALARTAGISVVAQADAMAEMQWQASDAIRLGSDHRAGGRALVTALAARGCRRVLTVWERWPRAGRRQHWMVERLAGIEAGCREHGLHLLGPVETLRHPDPEISEANFRRQVKMTVGSLFDVFAANRPDAILCASDGMVYDVIAAARKLAPDHNLLVTGYDNYWAHCPQRQWESGVPAFTVDRRLDRVGTAAARALLQAVKGTSTTTSDAVKPELHECAAN